MRKAWSCSPAISRRKRARKNVPGKFLVKVCAMKQFQPKAFLASHSSMLLDLYHNISYRNSMRKLARTFQRAGEWRWPTAKFKEQFPTQLETFPVIFLSSVNHILKTGIAIKESPNVLKDIKKLYSLHMLRSLEEKNIKRNSLFSCRNIQRVFTCSSISVNLRDHCP